MRATAVGVLLICWLLLAACATAPAGPGSRDGAGRAPAFPSEQAVRAVGLSPQEAANARQIYLFRCAKCHRFYDPAAYEQGEWAHWMQKMSKKAHLTSPEKDSLIKYLDAYRSETAAVIQ